MPSVVANYDPQRDLAMGDDELAASEHQGVVDLVAGGLLRGRSEAESGREFPHDRTRAGALRVVQLGYQGVDAPELFAMLAAGLGRQRGVHARRQPQLQ